MINPAISALSGPGTSPLRIAAFVADRWEHVCPSIRLVEPLAEAGLRLVKGNEWEEDQLRVFPDRISDADLVVIQRDFPSHVDSYDQVLRLARQLGKPVVYELDDLLLELGPAHPDFYHYQETRPSILRALLESDFVTTSTPSLAAYLRLFNPNVLILPNFLIDRFWSLKPPKEPPGIDAPIVIGYMGGHGHLADLEMVYPVLHRLLERYPARLQLKFWGFRPADDLLNRPRVSWSHPFLLAYSDFADYFQAQDCDLFIAPLQDNLFNRCKSGLKFLEYAALGIPGVFSDLPSYRQVVTHGQNGLLASSLAEWEAALVQLIEQPDLRERLGQAAQQTVSQDWLLSQNAYRWADVYNQVLAAPRAAYPTQTGSAALALQKTQAWYLEQNRWLLQFRSQASKAQKLSQKLTEAEQDIENLQHEVVARQKAAQQSQAQLDKFQNGASWKTFLRLRYAMLPNNSWRDRALHRISTAWRVWRSQGPRTTASLALQRLRGRAHPAPQSGASPSEPEFALQFLAVDGFQCPLPPVSILFFKETCPEDLSLPALETWLSAQTWPAWQLVIWDRAGSQAWDFRLPDQPFPAANFKELSQQLDGKYICFASHEILQQDATFIEANLITLASEDLAFTINLTASSDWANSFLRRGYYPGTPAEPFQKMFMQKSCINNDLQIDLSHRFIKNDEQAQVIAKVINHTTQRVESEGQLAFDQQLPLVSTRLCGNIILARPAGSPDWKTLSHLLHPLESVLPILDQPSSLPTVLVFMPFLAVGGAERIALNMISCLNQEIRFVVLTLDKHDPEIGNTVDAFRRLTPYVYTGDDFLNNNLDFSLVNYLINRYHPSTFYIANGSPWIYDALSTIHAYHPEIRLVNQVYDHQAGWINRYTPALARIFKMNIASNKKIFATYLEKGVDREAVCLIENGVSTAEFDPAFYLPDQIRRIQQKLGLNPDKKHVLFMARLHPQKRPMDFVEVARRCASDPDLHFLMVGDGVVATAVDQEIQKIGLKNITRLPFFQPSSELFSICDVYVLPSEYEGMPMVLLEAQAMGKPVVVTDVGNNRQVLALTNGGILVDKVGDITALRQAILKVLKSPPEAGAIRQAIIDHFSLPIMGEKYRTALLGPQN